MCNFASPSEFGLKSQGQARFEVVQAQAMGWCFGVRDAVELTRDLDRPERVEIYGELVHNESVLEDLRARGFEMRSEERRETRGERPEVLITAHGVSDRERARLEARSQRVWDTTCPLVRRAHRAALELAREGRFVVVVGRPGHVEVRGLIGDLEAYAVVERPEEVRSYGHPSLGVVFQTTTADALADRVLAAIRRRNPEANVAVRDTICEPTRQRQAALQSLITGCDLIIVVGGRNSNNSRALVERCHREGVRAQLVANASDLDQAWFSRVRRVGLTAGTSTPPEAIEEVAQALEAISRDGER